MLKIKEALLLVLIFLTPILQGCSTKATSNTTNIGMSALGLPGCSGTDRQYWNDCYGITRHYTNGVLIWEINGGYKNGKIEGKASNIVYGDEIHRCDFTNSNGKTEGWMVCYIGNKQISRDFYKNGIKAPEEAKRIELEAQKNECTSLGFKDKTPEMGNCILKLRELESIKNSNAANNNQVVIKKEPSDADKLNALNQLLQGAQQITGGGQTLTPNRTGAVCTKVSEQRNGVYKTCTYNCAGTSTTTTVKASEMCAANTNF